MRIASRTTVPVLVWRAQGCLGETVARAIHGGAGCPESTFSRIRCDRIDTRTPAAGLVKEAEEAAGSGGTIFLDLVERLPAPAQEKLARELDMGRFGAGARVLAGTRADLGARVTEGSFRQDLYHHLAVLIVEIPALRDRREDVSTLFTHLVSQVADSLERPQPSVPHRTIELCERYDWPRNIDQMRQVIERLLASGTMASLDPSALPPEIRHPATTVRDEASFALPPRGLNLGALERHLICQALDQQGGNRTRAARMLGLSRQAFLYRMKKHGLR
ncbi:MAG: hypothetical protein GTN89_09930 [Acidobacteria bacterium]|nr:hypothetical protein [Acidobacteriota bacterium]NIQ30673.1 hypothetical protein [Acidobacteriota bacterium]NIQ85631.1 hypothetical protein [Acidobacteriota bacterium]